MPLPNGDWASEIYRARLDFLNSSLVDKNNPSIKKSKANLRKFIAKTKAEWKAFAAQYQGVDVEFIETMIEMEEDQFDPN